MRTAEVFSKPIQMPATEVLAQLPPTPRDIHAVGMVWAKVWRITFLCITWAVTVFLCQLHFDLFIQTGSGIHWMLCVGILPISLMLLPWWLVTSYQRRKRIFLHCANIYRNGTAVLGTINTITNVNGPEQDCCHVDHKGVSSFGKVRVDYTFQIENLLKTGSVILRESSVSGKDQTQSHVCLQANDEICVIYLPDSPSDNIIFPVPGADFFEMAKIPI